MRLLGLEKALIASWCVGTATLVAWHEAFVGNFDSGVPFLKFILYVQIVCSAVAFISAIFSAVHWWKTRDLMLAFTIGATVSGVFLFWSASVALTSIEIMDASGVRRFWEVHALPQMFWAAVMFSMYFTFGRKRLVAS